MLDYLYAFSIFIGAFLLFQVQPLMGKNVLPWFGGTPTVWSTVLLFFQVLLTGGYAYAYWMLGRLRDRLQGIVHLALLGVSLVVLLVTALTWQSPLKPDAGWRPQSADLPIWGIIQILAIAVGIPYLVLSSNSTLMQAWFHRDNSERSPYRLYVLSNIGSLLALVSYPVIFEPTLTLQAQGYLWSAGYVLFAAGSAFLAVRTLRGARGGDQVIADGLAEQDARPARRLYLLWIGLAACASALLLSVSSQITQEVAVTPFLWVLPLTVYLLSFILAFSEGPWYSRRQYLIAFFVLGFVSFWMLVKYPPLDIILQVAVYLLLLFVCCMICHSELFKLRPHPRYLSSFYLMVAVGGAVGGIFVTFLAPFLFSSGFWELQWATIACGVLLALVIQIEQAPAPPQSSKQQRRSKARQRVMPKRRVWKPLVLVSSGLLLLQIVVVVLIMRSISTDALLATRNFYGVLRVWELNADKPKLRAYQETHGKTVHGFQFADSVLRVLPTTFYAESSGVGLSILNHPARPGALRIGVLGLGSGVLAAYGEPGDLIRFYEINPDVIRIAEGKGGYFTFLKDSAAQVQVIPGDARVSLERELASSNPQAFDLLVLDAFSGDAIPLHLLTKEAFQVYLSHLKPNGIVAINISNRYFRLDQEVFRLAEVFNLGAALIQDKGDGIQSYDSVWMLLTRDAAFLQQPAIASRTAQRSSAGANLPIWTDDFSNLLQILNWNPSN